MDNRWDDGDGDFKKGSGDIALVLLMCIVVVGLVGWFVVYVRGEMEEIREEREEQMETGRDVQAYILRTENVVVPDGVEPIAMLLSKEDVIPQEGKMVRLLVGTESKYVWVGEDVEKLLEGKEYITVRNYLNGLVLKPEEEDGEPVGQSVTVQDGVIVGKYVRTRPKMSDIYYLDVFAFNNDFRIEVSREEYKAYTEMDKVKVALSETDELTIVN